MLLTLRPLYWALLSVLCLDPSKAAADVSAPRSEVQAWSQQVH